MNQIAPIIKIYVTHEQQGSYIKNLILIHEGNNYHFPCRTEDTIYVFTKSICIYLLTINRAEGAISLYTFMQPEPDYLNSVTLHNLEEIREILGDKWETMEPVDIVSMLLELLS